MLKFYINALIKALKYNIIDFMLRYLILIILL